MAQLAHLSDVVRPSHQGRVGVPPGEDHLPRRTVQAGDHLFQWEQAGVHRSIISLEKELYNPSLLLAYRIAELFGVTVENLYCLKENRELEDRQYEDLQ